MKANTKLYRLNGQVALLHQRLQHTRRMVENAVLCCAILMNADASLEVYYYRSSGMEFCAVLRCATLCNDLKSWPKHDPNTAGNHIAKA